MVGKNFGGMSQVRGYLYRVESGSSFMLLKEDPDRFKGTAVTDTRESPIITEFYKLTIYVCM